jgi:Glutamine amidotransferase domain
MCGILGTSKLTQSTRAMLPYLGIEMSMRGTDSWGASDGSEILKHLGSIVDSYECPERWEGSRVIYHTRAASHGAKTLPNTHPFEFAKPDGSKVIGIHNGIIRNHDELNRKLSRNFDVDSMHIFAGLAEGRGVGDLEGYGAIAWFEDGELYLCRFGTTAMEVATLSEGELVFCSLYNPIDRVSRILGNPIKSKWVVDEYVKYHVKAEIGEDGEWKRDILLRCGEMDFEDAKKKIHLGVSQSETSSTWIGGTRREPWRGTRVDSGSSTQRVATGYWMNMDVCYVCRSTTIDPTTELLCPPCLRLQVAEFKTRNEDGGNLNAGEACGVYGGF